MFGRTSKCPKCGARLSKSGEPCDNCDFGHIILSMNPVESKSPNLLGTYVSDELIRQIQSKQAYIKALNKYIEEMTTEGRSLDIRYFSAGISNSIMSLTKELENVIVDFLKSKVKQAEEELEKLRSGE